MLNKTITQITADLQKRKYSCEELTRFALQHCTKFNEQLNCFITITEETALKQAKNADLALANGNYTALTGIPIAHKDSFCTADIKTSCGSKMLDNFIAPYDATIVSKWSNAGCILLGKTNMDEFSMGSSNEKSFYAATKNPWNLAKVPGGSSGGSSAAVAARLVCGATGSDSGGSVRQPAAFCGITGIKPTYGRISRYGMVAFASSLDHAGIFTKTAEDAALLLQFASGLDPQDSTSAAEPVPTYYQHLNNSIDGLKIGLPKEYFASGLEASSAAAIDTAIKQLEKLGAKVREISLPNSHLAVAVYYIIAPVECAANLARFDGIRFGYTCKNPVNLDDQYSCSRSEAFGEEVKRRIMLGTYILGTKECAPFFTQAQKIRHLISDDFKTAFQSVDVILGPTTPTAAFDLNAKNRDPVSMYLSDVYTIATNLAGLPAMSIPVGFSENLPIGMQLIGNYFTEGLLLNVAHRYQQITPYHLQTPSECNL